MTPDVKKMAADIAAYVLETEQRDFLWWLHGGEGAPHPACDTAEWSMWVERPDLFDLPDDQLEWIALNTVGHVYCDAARLERALAND